MLAESAAEVPDDFDAIPARKARRTNKPTAAVCSAALTVPSRADAAGDVEEDDFSKLSRHFGDFDTPVLSTSINQTGDPATSRAEAEVATGSTRAAALDITNITDFDDIPSRRRKRKKTDDFDALQNEIGFGDDFASIPSLKSRKVRASERAPARNAQHVSDPAESRTALDVSHSAHDMSHPVRDVCLRDVINGAAAAAVGKSAAR